MSYRLFRPHKHSVKLLGKHGARVSDVKVAFNGVTFVSAGMDRVVKIMHDGGAAFNLDVGPSPAVAVLLIDEDRRVLSRDKDGSIRCWDMEGKLLAQRASEAREHITYIDYCPAVDLVALAMVCISAIFYYSGLMRF
jgi:WD40 repeat protein